MDTIADLLRAEIDLPDEAGHQAVIDLFGQVQAAIEVAEENGLEEDYRILQKLKKRLTARVVPERIENIDMELAVQMLSVGYAIEKVNKRRDDLYRTAQALMLQATEQGLNQSDIARILGIDRNTVRKSTTKLVTRRGKDGKRTLHREPLTYAEFMESEPDLLPVPDVLQQSAPDFPGVEITPPSRHKGHRRRTAE